MAITLKQFVRDLADSGLLYEQDVSSIHLELSAEKRGDTRELAKELIRRKKLTKYQAAAV